MIEVQTVATNWKQLPTGLIWYVIGQPKSGKTTALSEWSDKGQAGTLIIDTDMGADFVDGANVIPCVSLQPPLIPTMMNGIQVVLDGIPIFERDADGNHIVVPPTERGYNYRVGEKQGQPMPVYSISEIVGWLLKEYDNLPYNTIVLDTIDQINTWNEHRTCKKMGIASMGQGEWGADWSEAKEGTLRSFSALRDLVKRKGGTLVIVSHSKETTIVPAKGKRKAITQLGPALPSGLATRLLGDVDIIGYTTGSKSDGQYHISFEAYEERKVGSRLRPIAQKELPFNYKAIIDIISKFADEGV